MNEQKNKEIKRDKAFMHIAYWTNRILFPPAKAIFVLWTVSWLSSLPGDRETPFGQKIVIVLFGYFLMCGTANLIYASNKKRYLAYKMRVSQKKIKRLRKLMYKTDPIQYEMQYGYDEEVTEKRGLLYRLLHKEPSAAERAQARLDRANQLASIINSTYNFEEFVKAYGELVINMEFLQSIENLSFFTGRKPSEDLAEIKEKRPLTEKEFVDRYLYQHGKESLASNKIYFDRLLPETVQYINSFLLNSSTESKPYNNFDYMEGHDFEYFCADILKKNGFENVEVTQGSGDHGIDILAEKDGITYAIQCKCYSSNIGNAAVQQAHTGKSIYKKDIAVVLTNRYFTAQAKEEAAALGVKLWDRDKLNSMIEKS
jgi:restriction system protein